MQMDNLEQALLERMRVNGGFLTLKTGYNFDSATCLRLEILASKGEVHLLSKTDKQLTYSLGGYKAEDYDEYSSPHFMAFSFDFEGQKLRDKVVSLVGDL